MCVTSVTGDDRSEMTTAEDSFSVRRAARNVVSTVCTRSVAVTTYVVNNTYSHTIFTALHGMQTRSSDEMSVCPSVRLSVKRMDCDKTKEISVQIFIPCKRLFTLLPFVRKRMVGGGDPFYLKFWVNRPPLEQNHRF